MNEEFPVHWLDEILEKILKREDSLITLATGKTPSGYIHLGILREIIICDALRRLLELKGKNVRFFLFFDSLDAAKRFPEYIEKDFQKKHIGKPFSYIPCPFKECNCESYAHHFGNDLSSTFTDFGIKTEIVWTHELYKTKEMQEKIMIALENIDKIKKIIRKYILPTLDEEKKKAFIDMQKTWMPVMAICEKCDRIQYRDKDGAIRPNRILEYLPMEEKVSYLCNACGNKNKLSIYSGRLKLNWRIDWPAKWSLYKTTCEPAGKDHSVKGGAYDTGIELCQELYDYIGPVKVPYEWLRLGDRDMKTSKGIVFTPKKYLEIADPEIFRTIILRTNPMKHIAFRIEEMPQYYDFFERMEEKFFTKEKEEEISYIYPLTQIGKIPNQKKLKIPFKLLIFLSQVQNILDLDKLYNKAKDAVNVNDFEKQISKKYFEKILKRTSKWLHEVEKSIEVEEDNRIRREIIRKINIFKIPETIDSKIIQSLDTNQKKGISILKEFLAHYDIWDSDLIQNKIFTIAKEILNIPPKKMFEAIYQMILGRKNGPKLGPFLALLDRDWLLGRLKI